MASINQIPRVTLLPDFRNLGVMLRVLLIVTGLTMVAAMLKSPNLGSLVQQWVGIAALVQPITILSVVLLGAGL
jgi:two-component system sensor histidine kinase AlgZ